MKRIGLILLLMGSIIHIMSAQSQNDYYSKQDTIIKGAYYTYALKIRENSVWLENIENKESHKSIIWTHTGEKAMFETLPWAYLDDDIEVGKLIRRVFSNKEIREYRKNLNFFEVGVIVDPATGATLEVGFTIPYSQSNNDNILLPIPISKLEEIEMLFKQELYFEVAPGSENASHIEYSIYPFNKHYYRKWWR